MSSIGRRLAQKLKESRSTETPALESVNWQVRTGLSVPFGSHMAGGGLASAPSTEPVNFQVRTGLSVPFASFMKSQPSTDHPVAEPVNFQVRTGLSVPFNPYMLGAHAEELLKKRVMISPVVVSWRYSVTSPEDFTDWLTTREILLSESRMAGDPEIKGVRYGGTYRIASENDEANARFKTIWGYTSEAAMHTMHRLCSDESVSATLVQLELIDFVKGLKRFIAEAGDEHFSEEVMISAAAAAA
ncbi:MAG TPA: hypothetical protein VF226_07370 [Hyphomicrobiaceae bacterium]|jgi:hypothetical protein